MKTGSGQSIAGMSELNLGICQIHWRRKKDPGACG